MIVGAELEQVEDPPLAESKVVMWRLPSMSAARELWNHPEYRAVVPIRQALGTFQILVVPGMDEAPWTLLSWTNRDVVAGRTVVAAWPPASASWVPATPRAAQGGPADQRLSAPDTVGLHASGIRRADGDVRTVGPDVIGDAWAVALRAWGSVQAGGGEHRCHVGRHGNQCV